MISTAPPQQSVQILPKDFEFSAILQTKKMVGCYALMLGFAEALSLDFDIAYVKQSDISWISVNHSKPGRAKACSLTVLSSNPWAQAHLDDDKAAVIQHLGQTVSQLLGMDATTADYIDLHKWRYANIDPQKKSAPLIDQQQQLAACGDWCLKGNVEAAFLSARALANSLISLLA